MGGWVEGRSQSWSVLRREKPRSHAEILTLYHLACSLFTMLTNIMPTPMGKVAGCIRSRREEKRRGHML